jgi:predicted nucleic acid-binding protein
MTAVPDDPTVVDATVLSNFAAVARVSAVAGLSGVCTTPVVRDEIERGVENHPYLQSAVDAFEGEMPVVCISEAVADRESSIRGHLDPGEAQALAVADVHDGRLLTDDGDARTFARERSVTVVGSVGILLAAVDAGHISESTANRWLQTWIDEFGYYAPHRRLGDYR